MPQVHSQAHTNPTLTVLFIFLFLNFPQFAPYSMTVIDLSFLFDSTLHCLRNAKRHKHPLPLYTLEIHTCAVQTAI